LVGGVRGGGVRGRQKVGQVRDEGGEVAVVVQVAGSSQVPQQRGGTRGPHLGGQDRQGVVDPAQRGQGDGQPGGGDE
jgi:hypothetical protein